jgi:hypothetical protein
MLFGLFGGAKPHPLTAFCKKQSDPNDLLRVANNLAVDRSVKVNKRALLLSFMVMGAAGDLVAHLDRGLDGNSSQRVLGDTNLDVITAEAIIWIDRRLGTSVATLSGGKGSLIKLTGIGSSASSSKLRGWYLSSIH